MTPFPKLFDSYVKVTRKQLITVANGDDVPICRSRNITLESSIVLKDVLYVPQLTNNFIYRQKLTKDLNCSVTLLCSYCVFQDFATRKMLLIIKGVVWVVSTGIQGPKQ